MNWAERVEQIRRGHGDLLQIDLFFGRHECYVCKFYSSDKEIARGDSSRSMQEAVDRCYNSWKLSKIADLAVWTNDTNQAVRLLELEEAIDELLHLHEAIKEDDGYIDCQWPPLGLGATKGDMLEEQLYSVLENLKTLRERGSIVESMWVSQVGENLQRKEGPGLE